MPYEPVNQDDQEDQADSDEKEMEGILGVLSENYFLASLLVCIPLGFASHLLGWAAWARFTCNFLAILPMAWLIGACTEELAKYTGDLMGGLLNATFGNVVELLLCIAGIRNNQITIVKCTLVGSILSNSLLVLGSSLIYGGYYHNGKDGPGYQSYNPLGVGAANSLMVFSCLGLVFPTLYKFEMQDMQSTLTISRGFSVFLLLGYVQYLYFQLKTHGHFFQGENEEEDEDGKKLSQSCAVGTLFTLTILTSFCSEFLICSIEGAIAQWSVSREFIGIILLPIIGNAAEHYSAILFAGKDRMNLTMSVAMGSAVQMALLATPLTVVFGWVLGKPVDLNFHQFQVVVYVLSVLLVANVLKNGTANWLEGCILVLSYVLIALIYFYENKGFTSTIMLTGTTVYDFQ